MFETKNIVIENMKNIEQTSGRNNFTLNTIARKIK